MFSGISKFDKAYSYYKDVPPMLKRLLEYNTFPIRYELGNDEYILNQSYITKIAPVFYQDMLSVLLKLKKADEIEKVAKDAMILPDSAVFTKYFAAGCVVEYGRKRNMDNDTLLDYLLENIKYLTRLDTAERRTVKEHNFPDYEKLHNDVMELLPKLKRIKYDTYGKAARLYLEELKDTVTARNLFMIAFSEGIGSSGSWNIIVGAHLAIDIMDKELGLKAVEMLKEYTDIDTLCNELNVIARVYKTFGYISEARDYKRLNDRCVNKLVKKRRKN